MIRYRVMFPDVTREEEITLMVEASRIGAALHRFGTGALLEPASPDQLSVQSEVVELVQAFLRKHRPESVIHFMWIATPQFATPVADGVIVSADGVSFISLSDLTMRRAELVKKIYNPNFRDEYRRFVTALGNNSVPVTLIQCLDTTTLVKARQAMVDPYALYSISKKIWCGTAQQAVEPAVEWDRLVAPGMAVIAFTNTSPTTPRAPEDTEKFINLLRTYDPSRNPKKDHEDNEFVREHMAYRFFGRPYMLGPKGVFPGDAVVL